MTTSQIIEHNDFAGNVLSKDILLKKILTLPWM